MSDRRPTWTEACNTLMNEPGTAVYEAARVLLDRVVELEALQSGALVKLDELRSAFFKRDAELANARMEFTAEDASDLLTAIFSSEDTGR